MKQTQTLIMLRSCVSALNRAEHAHTHNDHVEFGRCVLFVWRTLYELLPGRTKATVPEEECTICSI